MEIYEKVMDLNQVTLASISETNYSPYIFSQIWKDSMNRNYYLLKKYCSNYQKTSHKYFQEKIRQLARNQIKQKRKISSKRINNQQSAIQLPFLSLQQNVDQNKPKRVDYNSHRLINSKNMNATVCNFVKMDSQSINIRNKQNSSRFQRTKIKMSLPKKKSLNIVQLGQNELMNNEKIQRYIAIKHKFFLLRFNHRENFLNSFKHNNQNSINNLTFKLSSSEAIKKALTPSATCIKQLYYHS